MLVITNAHAIDAQQKGYEIAKKSDRSDRGFASSQVKLNMVLRNASGNESARTLEIWTFEMPDESVGDKSLIIFSKPADVNGTALLSHAKILEPDNQWLYLPALKRTKRISSKNKSGPFVGSEFSFEDITGQELNKYQYKWLKAEPCGESTCDVIERYPLYKNSGYTKQIGWVSQANSQPIKIEYYDRKGQLLKTQKLSNYKLYNNKFWRALLITMTNEQTHKSTDLIFSDFTFDVGLNEGDFVKGTLKRL